MNRLLLLSILILVTAPLVQAQPIPVTTTSDVARVQYVRGVHSTAYSACQVQGGREPEHEQRYGPGDYGRNDAGQSPGVAPKPDDFPRLLDRNG
jgi:hypothetical protein